jgi:predicted lysophospholipase L1 biosynthesis ABC-type transport system permease subunit
VLTDLVLLLEALGLALGDELLLGDSALKIARIIGSVPTAARVSGGLPP